MQREIDLTNKSTNQWHSNKPIVSMWTDINYNLLEKHEFAFLEVFRIILEFTQIYCGSDP